MSEDVSQETEAQHVWVARIGQEASEMDAIILADSREAARMRVDYWTEEWWDDSLGAWYEDHAEGNSEIAFSPDNEKRAIISRRRVEEGLPRGDEYVEP